MKWKPAISLTTFPKLFLPLEDDGITFTGTMSSRGTLWEFIWRQDSPLKLWKKLVETGYVVWRESAPGWRVTGSQRNTNTEYCSVLQLQLPLCNIDLFAWLGHMYVCIRCLDWLFLTVREILPPTELNVLLLELNSGCCLVSPLTMSKCKL